MKLKGGIEDSFTIVLVVLLLGVLGIIGWYFADTFFTAFETMGLAGIPAETHQQMLNTFGIIDGAIGFVVVCLFGGSLALAFYSRGRPFLAMLAIFIQIFFIIASYFCKAFFQAFTTATPEIEAVATGHFPIAILMMNYMPFVCFIMLLGIIILYFTKPSQEFAQGV